MREPLPCGLCLLGLEGPAASASLLGPGHWGDPHKLFIPSCNLFPQPHEPASIETTQHLLSCQGFCSSLRMCRVFFMGTLFTVPKKFEWFFHGLILTLQLLFSQWSFSNFFFLKQWKLFFMWNYAEAQYVKRVKELFWLRLWGWGRWLLDPHPPHAPQTAPRPAGALMYLGSACRA